MAIRISRPSFVHEDSRFYQYFSKLLTSIDSAINTVAYKVEVDSSDTTPDGLMAKLQAGLNVALSVVNVGGDEKVKIDATTVDSFKVLVDGSDTTPDDLLAKLQAGTDISLTVINPGLNERVEIKSTAVSDTYKVLVDGADTTPDDLLAKLQAGTGISLSVVNPGLNEKVKIESISTNEITVFPLDPTLFPGYGIQKFGTDLNAAWASIPRADLTYQQNCNDWVVLIPAGVFTPASNDISVIGTTVSGSSQILDFGLTASSAIGRPITGPGIPLGTTIQSIGVIAGSFFATVTYTIGSNIITGIASTANLFIGQTVFSGGGAITLPYCTITSILGPNSIQVSINATASSGAISLSAAANVAATISNPATASNTAANFSVNIPLTITGTTNGTNILTGVNYVCNDMIGKTITGTNITPGTTVTAISYNSATNTGTLTLSLAATGSGAGIFQFQIPSIFFCDIMRRRICNLNFGPTNLGKANSGSLQGAQFWSPFPGVDHFIDLYIQLATEITIYSTRQEFRWCGLDEHTDAWTTHEAYGGKTRLTGTVIFLDPLVSSSPNQQISLGDIEVFGNPGRYIQSFQQGSTNSTTTLTVTSTLNLYSGQPISGPNIPVGTLIQSITNATQLVMTLAATGSGTGVFTFDPGRIIQSIQAGTTVVGSTALTGLTSVTSLYPGQLISGTGIPANCYIQSITSLTSLTMTLAATVSATNTMTFTPAVISLDGSLLSATTTNFFSTYKSRWRNTILCQNHWEIGMAENVEFSAPVFIQQYSHIASCAIKAGMIWTANSNNFDVVGIYGSQIYTTAAFIGVASAPLRMDSATNYWFKSAGATLGLNTVKLILSDNTSSAVALTAQTTSLGPTTTFTPATDGVYQISVYASCTVAGTAGTMTPVIGWRDDTTTQSLSLAALPLGVLGGYVQQIISVKCKAGQPITYTTTVAGALGSPQYAFYMNVIQLS